MPFEVKASVAAVMIRSLNSTRWEASFPCSVIIRFSILLKKELRFDDKQLTVGDVKESHWLWGTMKIVRDTYRDVIIASLLINIFVLATPLFTMNVYDRVIPNDAKDTLWILSIGVLIVYGIDVVLKFLRTYFLETAGKKTDIIASS
jgi:ATP-binding cassette subfamily C protein LapB